MYIYTTQLSLLGGSYLTGKYTEKIIQQKTLLGFPFPRCEPRDGKRRMERIWDPIRGVKTQAPNGGLGEI